MKKQVIAVACGLTLTATAEAQAVIGGQTQARPLKAPVDAGAHSSGIVSNIKAALTEQAPLVQSGFLAIRPHISYGLIYGDGILRAPGEPEHTTIQTISPGLVLEAGYNTAIEYTLTRSIYSSELFTDSNDHSAQLRTGRSFDKTRFDFLATYSVSSPTLIETGGQTSEKKHTTTLVLAYELRQRSLFEVTIDRSTRSASPITRNSSWTGSDWEQWSASTWINYSFNRELNGGLGLRGGYDRISDNPDMTHTRPQARLTFQPTKKLNVSGDVGIEDRRTRHQNVSNEENLVYSSSIRYQASPTTAFSLSGDRQVSISYFADQISKGESWTTGFEQRILTRVYFSANFTRGTSSYLPTVNQEFPERDDKRRAFDIMLSTRFLKRGTLSFTYQRTKNVSDLSFFTFSSSQFGANISYRYRYYLPEVARLDAHPTKPL